MYARILIQLFGIFGFVRAYQSFFGRSPSNPPIATVSRKQRARRGSSGSAQEFLNHLRFFDKTGGPSRQFMSKSDGTEKDKSRRVSFESAQKEDDEELDEETLIEIESGQPSEWTVMKEVSRLILFESFGEQQMRLIDVSYLSSLSC